MPLRRSLLAALALAATSCTLVSAPVELDHFRGAYSTHFEGIPDRGSVCALVTNRGLESVEWLRLRLVSASRLGEQPGRWISYWTWSGRLDAGESVALELPDPPMADEIRLELRQSGRGPASGSGRKARAIAACSDDALRVRLERPDRPGVRVVPVALRNRGAHDPVLVADR